MAQTGTLAHLAESVGHLTGTEQQVINVILEDPARVLHDSISELAQRCGVSESTVVRACKRVGYQGYPQLKMALAMDLATTYTTEQGPKFVGQVDLQDPPDEIIKKVFETNLRSMRRTLQQLNTSQFERALEAVLRAGQVAVFANGTDAHMVDHCVSKLILTGLHCAGRTDHVQQTMLVTVMAPGDALIVFSHSGRMRSLVEVIEKAKARGIVTIAFTSFAQSPLARSADISVTAYSGDQDFYLQAMGSQIARMVLVDCLLVAVACRKADVAVPNFEATRKSLADLRM